MLPEKNISFEFMKYVRPIWYFHLKPHDSKNSVWSEYKQLSKKEKELIQYDKDYSTLVLSNWDASFQALMRGLIKQVGNDIPSENIELIPADIYRFMRKYHKKIWLYGTFFQRLINLYNPIYELVGLFETRHVKQINLFEKHYVYKDYFNFESQLIRLKPLVNIIIPTLNRYEALNNLLLDLEKQTYTNFELIVIDQSNQFYKEFYKKFNFNYHIIRQEKPALWRARNRGIKSAQSEYLLFLDDDSRVAPSLLSEHLKCLDYFQADISSGISISRVGAKVPENYYYFRWGDQLDTGNVLIKKKVFEKCGLFDEQFEKMRMGDGEFGVRAYLNEFKNISNPKASREHLKISKGGLREMGHWDAFRSKYIFSPRPIPSVLYLYRKYWGTKAAILEIMHSIPLSFCPYYLKGKRKGYILSLAVFILLWPFIMVLMISSFKLSTRMLNSVKGLKHL